MKSLQPFKIVRRIDMGTTGKFLPGSERRLEETILNSDNPKKLFNELKNRNAIEITAVGSQKVDSSEVEETDNGSGKGKPDPKSSKKKSKGSSKKKKETESEKDDGNSDEKEETDDKEEKKDQGEPDYEPTGKWETESAGSWSHAVDPDGFIQERLQDKETIEQIVKEKNKELS